MDRDTIKKDAYTTIGEFITKANTFEFLINTCVEQIVLSISDANSEFKNDVSYSIDTLHKQSLRERISFIIMILTSKKDESDASANLLRFFNSLYKTYNKTIRDYRDFVAHNPFMLSDKGNGAIINSRRYTKQGIQSLTITEIQKLNISLIPLLEQLVKACEEVQSMYPGALVVRELDPKVQQK